MFKLLAHWKSIQSHHFAVYFNFKIVVCLLLFIIGSPLSFSAIKATEYKPILYRCSDGESYAALYEKKSNHFYYYTFCNYNTYYGRGSDYKNAEKCATESQSQKDEDLNLRYCKEEFKNKHSSIADPKKGVRESKLIIGIGPPNPYFNDAKDTVPNRAYFYTHNWFDFFNHCTPHLASFRCNQKNMFTKVTCLWRIITLREYQKDINEDKINSFKGSECYKHIKNISSEADYQKENIAQPALMSR